jgi:rhodanese-related sulfurtransferase
VISVSLGRPLDENAIELLTGHAGARFIYVDVRDERAFAANPPRHRVVHVPLDELRVRAPEMFGPQDELVVYGSNDIDTEAGAATLKKSGCRRVFWFDGGFRALRRAGMV